MAKLPCKDCYWRISNIRGRGERNIGKAMPASCYNPHVTLVAPYKQQFLPAAYKYCNGEGFRNKKDKY